MGVDMKVKAIYDSEIGNITRCMSCSFTYRKRHLKRWGFITLIPGQRTLVK